MIKTVLTIAGSDCSGGAGIQADIKTITAHKMYAMSAITALTAQNTTGVYDIYPITADFVALQLDCIFKDIPPDAVKIGMVQSNEIIDIIVTKLKEYNAKNIVIDPVITSTSGSSLLCSQAIETIIKTLLPIANIITPNIAETETLAQLPVKNENDMILAAKKISALTSSPILIKGGHLKNKADDLLYIDGNYYWYRSEKINNPNTHGTGCTLSTAIACNLAKNMSLQQSIENAKNYITGALKSGLNIGKGLGPLNHVYSINIE
ncbi:hydroxymethylpyrimidine/phosphomethylpyrimidine kinase [Brevinema andersonii]|uniref:hydroxymethylpyrimidine kinase n=1 Tax=Brevinema andersonii TaxID=34097 RepID=A0A1I1EVZ8_BREAD|nr:bifunctional hydroxymethylpyrimidine kinase/phosphomethylpyrimidine kinase [Brevinema andersonii]SFB90896.1 hydroxymethylpyrimidine/phosphomethylpyrimidine kinase [Brevinema andersonii]